MLTVLLALSGCVWVSEEAHEGRINDTVSITLDGAPVAFACAPALFVLAMPFTPPADTEFTWDLGEGRAQGTEVLDPSAAETAFALSPDELERACDTASCTVPLTVQTRLRGVDTSATFSLEVVRQVEVSLSSDGTALIDLATPVLPPEPVDPPEPVLPRSAVFVESVPEVDVAVVGALAFEGALLLCPLGAPESPECLRSEFSGPEAVAATAPLDLCPDAVFTTVGWQLYGEIVPDSCSAALPIVALDVLRFLSSDCDQDGVSNQVDCDDLDPDVNFPVDVFGDGDGDGFGAVGSGVTLYCGPENTVPAGFSLSHTDCDDGDATFHVDAADDTCDLQDQDCDGDVDEDAPDFLIYGADHDGDGYGDGGTTQGTQCDDYTIGFDCNDSNANVHPGATEDYSNLLDEDCNGIFACETLDCVAGAEHRILAGAVLKPLPGSPFDGISISELASPQLELDVGLGARPTAIVVTHATPDGIPDVVYAIADEVWVMSEASQVPELIFTLDPGVEVVEIVAGYFQEETPPAAHLLVITTDPDTHYRRAGVPPGTLMPVVAPLGTVNLALAADVDAACGDEVVVFSDDGLKIWRPPTAVEVLDSGSYDDGFITDLDGDGSNDIVAWGDAGIHVAYGGGAASMQVTSSAVSAVARTPARSDFLFFAFEGDSSVNTVEVGMLPALLHTLVGGTEAEVRSLTTGDFDGDGTEDLVVGTAWFQGRDTVLFGWDGVQSEVALGFSSSSVRVQALDVNGDGIDDILMEDDGVGGGTPAYTSTSAFYFLGDPASGALWEAQWRAQVTAPVLLVGERFADPRVRLRVPDCMIPQTP